MTDKLWEMEVRAIPDSSESRWKRESIRSLHNNLQAGKHKKEEYLSKLKDLARSYLIDHRDETYNQLNVEEGLNATTYDDVDEYIYRRLENIERVITEIEDEIKKREEGYV